MGNVADLSNIAKAIVAREKGILAADESSGTIKRRFDAIGVESTEDNRRDYRELLFRTPGAERVHQRRHPLRRDDPPERRRRHAAGQGPPGPGHHPRHQGRHRRRSRWPAPRARSSPRASTACASASPSTTSSAPRFSKWRAVITIGESIPSDYCIEVNAHALARYAALSQEAGIVPIVEPEVLMEKRGAPSATTRSSAATR